MFNVANAFAQTQRFASIALAAAFWLGWAVWLTPQAISPVIWLVIAQYGLTACRMVWRAPAKAPTPWPWQGLAWFSALLPLALRPISLPSEYLLWALVLQLSGLSLAVWALASLGAAFGIAPADRGLVQHGPYRWLRHPAYAGELLALAGAVVAYPSLWNVGVWVVIAFTLALRVQAEEATLAGYGLYAAQVQWRLFPGVW